MLKLLVAIDGSELSLDGVRHVLGLIRRGLQAEVVLANVQESATLYELVVAHDPQVLHEISQSAGTHQLASAVALLQAANVAHVAVVESGDPAHMLMDLVERYACDGVVLGARGHGNVHGVLVGSVSQHMVHNCPVPVTVVKH